MNIEDIKVGETYYVPFTVKAKSDKYVTATTGGTLGALLLAENLHPIPSAPKYDPNRSFRKGDKVQIVMNKGRHFNYLAEPLHLCVGVVAYDETPGEYVDVCVPVKNSEKVIDIDAAYLELVTPVEELEPYSVTESTEDWCIQAKKSRAVISRYSKRLHPHAKEAAEAECDRLNAETRKEQK